MSGLATRVSSRGFQGVRKKKKKNRRGGFRVKGVAGQYSQRTQVMGPGTTIKNFEKVVTVEGNTEVLFDNTTVVRGDDFDSSCRQYRYLRIIGMVITQNLINLPNEQKNVYVRASWSSNNEAIEDIPQDDASKILPNIGTKCFTFKPPNAQVSYFRNSTTVTINLSGVISTEHLLQATDQYAIPGQIMIYNQTASARDIRIVIRMKFIGSNVIDAVAEAKRVLKQKGLIGFEEMKKIEEKEREMKEENTKEKKEKKNVTDPNIEKTD